MGRLNDKTRSWWKSFFSRPWEPRLILEFIVVIFAIVYLPIRQEETAHSIQEKQIKVDYELQLTSVRREVILDLSKSVWQTLYLFDNMILKTYKYKEENNKEYEKLSHIYEEEIASIEYPIDATCPLVKIYYGSDVDKKIDDFNEDLKTFLEKCWVGEVTKEKYCEEYKKISLKYDELLKVLQKGLYDESHY